MWVMKMAITIETIHREMQQVKAELLKLRSMLENEGNLTDEARRKCEKAREEMAKGEFVSHEEIMAKYG